MPTDKAPEWLLGAFAGEGNVETFKVQTGQSVSKGDVVKLVADRTVQQSGAGDKSIGVALRTGSAGDYIPVLVRGKVKVTAGGAISAGAAVKAGASGRVVAAVAAVTIPSGATTVTSSSAQPSMTVEACIALGVALDAASADGDTSSSW